MTIKIERTPFFDAWNERMPDGSPRFTPFTLDLGWHLREDGDIEAYDGVFPLEDFAAAGRIDSVQLEMAREIKAKWLAKEKAP